MHFVDEVIVHVVQKGLQIFRDEFRNYVCTFFGLFLTKSNSPENPDAIENRKVLD